MSTTQKKPGRPRLSRKEQKEKADQLKNDGERLRSALNELDLSQAEAERQSGVKQGHLTEIIAGTRGLLREDLRALGRIGISADYLLGLTDTLLAPGQTRTRTELIEDLRAEVMDRACAGQQFPPRLRKWADAGNWFDGEYEIDRLATELREDLKLRLHIMDVMARPGRGLDVGVANELWKYLHSERRRRSNA